MSKTSRFDEKTGRRNVSGKYIRQAREKRGLTQVKLTSKLRVAGLKIDVTGVSNIEKGKRSVMDFELRKFSEVLGVSMLYLLGYIPCWDGDDIRLLDMEDYHTLKEDPYIATSPPSDIQYKRNTDGSHIMQYPLSLMDEEGGSIT